VGPVAIIEAALFGRITGSAPMPRKRDVPIRALSITLPAEDVEVLRALAQRLDRPLSYVIEGMLEEHIALTRRLMGIIDTEDDSTMTAAHDGPSEDPYQKEK